MGSMNKVMRDETMHRLVKGAVPNPPRIKTATRADAARVTAQVNEAEKKSPATKP
jgi:hypothetical protein